MSTVTTKQKSTKDRLKEIISVRNGFGDRSEVTSATNSRLPAFTRSCNRRTRSSSCPPSTSPIRSTDCRIGIPEISTRKIRRRSFRWRKCRISSCEGSDFRCRRRRPRPAFTRSCTGSVVPDPGTISRPSSTRRTSSSRPVSNRTFRNWNRRSPEKVETVMLKKN